jgi:hypothetical protein
VGIMMQGPVLQGDTERFRQFLRQQQPNLDCVSFIYLNSPGGNVDEALRLGGLIHDELNYARTIVEENNICASACFWLFTARPERWIAATARIGVHSVSDWNGQESSSSLATTAELARFAHRIGIPDQIIVKLITAQPGGIAWLSKADLAAMKVKIFGIEIERDNFPPGTIPRNFLRPGPDFSPTFGYASVSSAFRYAGGNENAPDDLGALNSPPRGRSAPPNFYPHPRLWRFPRTVMGAGDI